MNTQRKIYDALRKNVRNFVLDVLSLNSIPQPGIHILNGHFLSLKQDALPDIFRRQLSALKGVGIEFIDFDSAVELIDKKDFPSGKCMVAFTFDDGFEECFTKIRPVLNEYGIKAGFFINPNFVNGDKEYQDNFKKNIVYTNKSPMNWDQINQLKDEGHIIGAHTMDHLKLDIQDIHVLEYQIGESKKVIKTMISSECQYFAFPYGKMEHISELGIEIAQKHFNYIFSQSNYMYYFSANNRVINRRHFECDWPYNHVIYFLKNKRQ